MQLVWRKFEVRALYERWCTAVSNRLCFEEERRLNRASKYSLLLDVSCYRLYSHTYNLITSVDLEH